jgi:hypothetical protein
VLWVVLFVFSFLCCIFAATSLFFNGELNRGLMDADIGIVPLLSQVAILSVSPFFSLDPTMVLFVSALAH